MNVVPKKILIYRLGSMGDTILALPAFRLVRNKFPNSEITILTNIPVSEKAAPVESVLENTGLYDKVLKYPLGLPTFGDLLSLRKAIQDQHFDLAVYMTQPRGMLRSLRDYIFFRLCNIKNVIGVPFRQDGLYSLYQKERGLYTWEAERLVRCLQTFGDVDLQNDDWWDLGLTSKELVGAKEILAELTRAPSFLAMSIGTKCDVNDWTDRKWSRLLALIGNSYPSLGIVAIGAKDEWRRSEELLAGWKGPKINLCGITSPRTSAAVMKSARVFIGHDSGPMHLAGAVGVPCVAIFSARNFPGQWFPRGSKNKIFYNKTFCFGCRLDNCLTYGKQCILSIRVEDVFNSLRAYVEDF